MQSKNLDNVTDESQPLHNGIQSQASLIPEMAGTKLPKIISFQDICRCGDEVWIECDRQVYRLRRTKQGKLILTK